MKALRLSAVVSTSIGLLAKNLRFLSPSAPAVSFRAWPDCVPPRHLR